MVIDEKKLREVEEQARIVANYVRLTSAGQNSETYLEGESNKLVQMIHNLYPHSRDLAANVDIVTERI